MSRWTCNCGHEMRDGGDSSPCSLIVPRQAFDDLLDQAHKNADRLNPPRTPPAFPDLPELWTCPACGGLHIIRDNKVEYWIRDKEPVTDYLHAIVEAAKGAHPNIVDAEASEHIDDPHFIRVEIVTRGPADFLNGPERRAATDAARAACPAGYQARVVRVRWTP